MLGVCLVGGVVPAGGGLVVSGFPAHAVLVPLVGVGVGVLELLVENCIVDASILKRSNF